MSVFYTFSGNFFITLDINYVLKTLKIIFFYKNADTADRTCTLSGGASLWPVRLKLFVSFFLHILLRCKMMLFCRNCAAGQLPYARRCPRSGLHNNSRRRRLWRAESDRQRDPMSSSVSWAQ